MKNESVRVMTGPNVHSRVWTAVLCGIAGFALAIPAAAKDQPVVNFGAPVDFYATVGAIHEVPVGDPMPGLHFDVKVKGRVLDVYVAPMDFVAKYGVVLSRGDEVRVVGKQIKSGEADVVLANEITTGFYDNKGGIFHADMTFYLRNEDGPFWKEDLTPAAVPVAAH